MSYFPKPHSSKNKTKGKLDCPNYLTKSDLKNVTDVIDNRYHSILVKEMI